MTQSQPIDPPDQSKCPWQRRWMPGWRAITVIALIILALPLGIRWARLWRAPNVPEPFDVEAFCELPPAENNAFDYYRKAVLQFVKQPEDRDFWELFQKRNGDIRWDDVPDSIRHHVASQQAVMDLFRQGGRCADASFLSPRQYTINTTLPVHQEMRGLFRLAFFDALRLLDEGNTREAVEVLQDSFRASRHLGRRGCLIERLIGVSCQAILLPAWHQWSRHPQVTAEDLETALARLRENWQMTPPVSDQLKLEYLMILNEAKPPMLNLRTAFDDAIERFAVQRLGLSAQATMTKLSSITPGWQSVILWTIGEPELSARVTRLYLTHELKFCDLPLADQPPRLPGRYEMHDARDLTGGLTAAEIEKRLDATFASHLLGAWPQYQRAIRNEAGRQMLLETNLELQIRIRRMPAASRADVEQILADFEWPVDPCSLERQPIQYRVEEQGLVLWSVGWDSIDQGGEINPEVNRAQDSVVVIPWPGAEMAKGKNAVDATAEG